MGKNRAGTDANDAAAERVKSATNNNGSFTAGLVLIAEDDEPIAFALSLVVEDAGYAVTVAGDGRLALALAQEQHPALIITDLMMPGMTGQQFIAALRRNVQNRLPPIVVMSAADPDLAEEVDADAFLSKPFEIEQVERLLQQFLESTPAGC
ncbi:MAG: response regulator [Ktedonobacterales bacterium]